MRLTALARQAPAPLPEAAPAPHVPARAPARTLWALLLARIYEILPLRCTVCGGEMRIIAFVTHAPAIHSILTYLGEPTLAPEVAPARGPPRWEQAAQSHCDDTLAPAPSVGVRPARERVGPRLYLLVAVLARSLHWG